MNLEKLRGVIPDSRLAQLPDVISKFKIDTPCRLAHFLAQVAHESGNFTRATENLNYTDVKRIALIFRKYVDTDRDGVIEPHELEAAKKYVKKPKELANLVYANRMGNGDTASGDGYLFRGRGDIQLTGKENYAAFDKFVEDDIVANPELVATKYPLLSAAWFFTNRGLHLKADKGSTHDVVVAITVKVNGGTHGLEDRIMRFDKYFKLLA